MSAVIEVKCLQCGKSTKVRAEMAGKKGKCPVCGRVISIPDPKVKADMLGVNKDVSDDEVRRAARQLANGTGMKAPKKRGFFARLFGGRPR